MLSSINSCSVQGIEGVNVEAEVDIRNGLPVFSIVGLPDNTVKESRDRVKSAISNSGYAFPNKKITVNLAPADLKKEGAGFDLPIAIGILAASELIVCANINEYTIVGELALDGRLRPVPGCLSMALAAKKIGRKGIIVPSENSQEAAVVKDLEVYGVKFLYEVVEFLSGLKQLEACSVSNDIFDSSKTHYSNDFSDVKGQFHAKRALEIAAAGGHNILLKGPPGSGKTMLAKRLPTILPDLNFTESLETTQVYSVTKSLSNDSFLITQRPFRTPHHTISDAGLIGGGTYPKPGEISLSHNGVLFLDELPEFKRNVLESLRQPIEDGEVTISRSNVSYTFPTKFMLVVSMNPCPCGFFGDSQNRCVCTPNQVQKYQNRVSGPLLDRIDLCIDVPAVPFNELQEQKTNETSVEIKKRVYNCRQVQNKRFLNHKNIFSNSQMGSKEIEIFCHVDKKSSKLLENSMEKLGISARGYHRILKIARTIADLTNSNEILFSHVAEAIQYRRISFDK